ncbi:hypothetical protein BHE74_00019317, partial [Ensete ventricosum]
QNEEPIERHNLTLASTRVHALDLCLRKASCLHSMFHLLCQLLSCGLGYFTKFLSSRSAARFALN